MLVPTASTEVLFVYYFLLYIVFEFLRNYFFLNTDTIFYVVINKYNNLMSVFKRNIHIGGGEDATLNNIHILY